MSICWIFVHDRTLYNSLICDSKGKVILEDGSVRIFTSMKEAVLTARMLGLEGFTIIGRTQHVIRDKPKDKDFNLYRSIAANTSASAWLHDSASGWLIDTYFID